MEKTFAEDFKEARKKKDISYKKLSDLTGISAVTLFQYEKKINFPSESSLKKLCKYLNLNFTTSSKQIQKEKARKETKKNFSGAAWPDLRQEFLNHYTTDLLPSELRASLRAITQELETSPFHPFESFLLYMAMRHLEKENMIASDKKDYFYNIAEEAKKKRIEQAKLHWFCDENFQILHYAFGEKISRFEKVDLKPQGVFVHPPEESKNKRNKQNDTKK